MTPPPFKNWLGPLGFLKLLRLIIGYQVVDEFIYIALHDTFQLIKRQADAVIRYTSLGKIVGSDPAASVAGKAKNQLGTNLL